MSYFAFGIGMFLGVFVACCVGAALLAFNEWRR